MLTMNKAQIRCFISLQKLANKLQQRLISPMTITVAKSPPAVLLIKILHPPDISQTFPANLLAKYWKTKPNTTKANTQP